MTTLTRHDPFNEMISLREALSNVFEDSFIPRSGSTRRGMVSNLYETAEGFVLQLPLAGANPEDVEIIARQNTVYVKWTTQVSAPENATTHWSGFASSRYQQSFTLPTPIDVERAEASYENGILTITLPKEEQARARQVKVQISTPALV